MVEIETFCLLMVAIGRRQLAGYDTIAV